MLLLAVGLLTACTTLGPTPATTAVSALPAARPELDAQLAIVPGYFLSSAVAEDPAGTGIVQLSAVFEPARLLPAPGVIVGARLAGESGDSQLEPLVGYRRSVGASGRLALAGLAFGTRGEASRDDASYTATRAGAELAADLRILAESRWSELHVTGALSATWLSADGDYCTDTAGDFGRMCADPGDPPSPRLTGSASGVYPAATVGAALHSFRHRDGAFHGARLAIMFAAGRMPRVIAGEQTTGVFYSSLGLAISIALGGD